MVNTFQSACRSTVPAAGEAGDKDDRPCDLPQPFDSLFRREAQQPRAVPSRFRFAVEVLVRGEKRGLSQEQLGYTAQLHRNYVGGVERGERNPSLVNIYKLARALNVEPPDLLALSIRRIR